MLGREEADKILRAERTAQFMDICLSAIQAELSTDLRPAAYVLLNRNENGEEFNYQKASQEEIKHHEEFVKRGFKLLASLPSVQRRAVFATLAPLLADTIEAAWQLFARLPYQIGWGRRPFRAPDRETALFQARIAWVHCVGTLAAYRDKDLSWFAAWAPHLYYEQQFGLLFAAAIDGEAGQEVFDALLASSRGDHPIGRMGRHVTTGLLTSANPDGWDAIERLLLAAQRQEGLRQVILETVDEAHPQAFRRMLQLILDHDLIRFSAVIRAVDVWFGFGLDVEHVRVARQSIQMALSFLNDVALCQETIKHGNPQETYLALWTVAYEDALRAIPEAVSIFTDEMPERRFVAAHLLGLLNLPEARQALLPFMDDPDLRVAVSAFNGIARNVSDLDLSDLFERLKRLYRRIDEKEQTLKSGVWPWLEIAVQPQSIIATMIQCVADHDARLLLPYLPAMGKWQRRTVVEKLAKLPTWDAEIRNLLFEMVGDRSQYVRSTALKCIAERSLDNDGTLALEQLLTRKSRDLRRGILEILLKGSDEAVLESSTRLLNASHQLQRMAGLDLLNDLVKADRAVQQSRSLAQSYCRQELKPEELPLVEAILTSSSTTETLTLENVLGLITQQELSPRIPPRLQAIQVDTPAVRACLRSLVELIKEYSTTPVIVKTWRGSEEMLFVNIQAGYSFSYYVRLSEENILERLPLADVWRNWLRERPAETHDTDNLELLRARLLLNKTRAASATTEEGIESLTMISLFGCSSNDVRTYHQLLNYLLPWLTYLQGITVADLDFLLDVTETALASIPVDALKRELAEQRDNNTRGNYSIRDRVANDSSLQLLDEYKQHHPTMWTPVHHTRYWQLLHWFDQPLPGLARYRPSVQCVLAAHSAGSASEADIFDQLVGQSGWNWSRHTDLSLYSTREQPQDMLQYPILQKIVRALRDHIIAIELERGEMPTAASPLISSLHYSGGTALFVRVLSLLEPTDLIRSDRHGEEDKAVAFSHLLRVSYPGLEDTLEDFARQVRDARLDDNRLIAAAVYVPQWARHIEYALNWPHFEDAVWWVYAHTKDQHYSVEHEIRKIWQAQVAERTALTAAELLAGAVDVAWFWRTYSGLGAERWEQVYIAAKYASSNIGHRRARLFADAMTGKLDRQEIHQRIFQKRQQDEVRAFGLIPLPVDDAAREAEIVDRYQVFQEFRRTGRTFGAQRRTSEESATKIGLENLSRTAGYVDPLRLQWAMEARTASDLHNGNLTVNDGDISVTLAIDPMTAVPRLSIVKGETKRLNTLPARLKKHEQIASLMNQKKEIERQISRMRASLENAMCRGDRFTPGELMSLLDHPALSRLLHNLIFVRIDDGQDEIGTVLGYPLIGGGDSAPQLCFSDDKGAIIPIDFTSARLRLAHPYDLLKSQLWHTWQHECFAAERIQPFKQVFRELYIPAKSETRNDDEALSQRYSGHQVQQRQAMALFSQRGWIVEYGGASRVFHQERITVNVTFDSGVFTSAEVEGLTIGQLYFNRHDTWKPMPLVDVPPRLFSEAMRDIDLVVSVAHSGGVDPEATASTVEMRSSLVNETCALLNLTNVTLKSSHALIEGTIGNYSIHLGSAVVHLLPGRSLCIIPVHAQHRGRIFLPFADDDPKTAEVITKVITLARDKEIKDPTILEQLR